MTNDKKLLYLIKYLLSEEEQYKSIQIPSDEKSRFEMFRSLVNIRPPKQIDDDFLHIQNDYLQELIALKGISDIADMHPVKDNIYLWKGDITTLRCGAIVNAANSQLLGCFQPCHSCIDNAIHTFSGVQLRMECAAIMEKQGHYEPVGQARVTAAYNLPCEKIIHTVGPVVNGELTEMHCRELEGCYIACLKAAAEKNIDSIAFCCISTGVFGFPQREAAKIAVDTIRKYSGRIKVIFNVFKQTDFDIYRELLTT